jgi:hypothetical protein
MSLAVVFRDLTASRNFAAVLESDLGLDSVLELDASEVLIDTCAKLDEVIHPLKTTLDVIDASIDEIQAINSGSEYSSCVREAIKESGIELAAF